MNGENWRDIVGYEGLYQVSNLGMIKSLDRIVSCRWGQNKRLNGNLLSMTPDPDGYLSVALSKQGKRKTYRVHKLVAQAFIPNPEKLPSINHKDENKTNNNVKNLEWCTVKYNNNYKDRQQKIAQKRKGVELPKIRGKNNGNAKKIICITTGKVFDTNKEASKFYNANSGSISGVCKRNKKT